MTHLQSYTLANASLSNCAGNFGNTLELYSRFITNGKISQIVRLQKGLNVSHNAFVFLFFQSHNALDLWYFAIHEKLFAVRYVCCTWSRSYTMYWVSPNLLPKTNLNPDLNPTLSFPNPYPFFNLDLILNPFFNHNLFPKLMPKLET